MAHEKQNRKYTASACLLPFTAICLSICAQTALANPISENTPPIADQSVIKQETEARSQAPDIPRKPTSSIVTPSQPQTETDAKALAKTNAENAPETPASAAQERPPDIDMTML